MFRQEMAENGALSANQKRAITALLSEPTVKGAAKTAKLGARTIHRYLDDPLFRAELQKRRDKIVAATAAALVGLSGEAVATLLAVLQDADASNAVKVRAALGWLSHTRDALELDDLTARVEKLEARLK